MCSCHISNLTASFFLLVTAFLSQFQLHVTGNYGNWLQEKVKTVFLMTNYVAVQCKKASER